MLTVPLKSERQPLFQGIMGCVQNSGNLSVEDFFFRFPHSLSSEEDHVMEAASSWQSVAEGKPFSHCSVTINIWIRNRKKPCMLKHKQYAPVKWACELTRWIKRWGVCLLRKINTFYLFFSHVTQELYCHMIHLNQTRLFPYNWHLKRPYFTCILHISILLLTIWIK